MDEPQVPATVTMTEPSTKRKGEDESTEDEIKVVDDEEDTVSVQKPEILKEFGQYVFHPPTS